MISQGGHALEFEALSLINSIAARVAGTAAGGAFNNSLLFLLTSRSPGAIGAGGGVKEAISIGERGS
jgi:hypothetical protein